MSVDLFYKLAIRVLKLKMCGQVNCLIVSVCVIRFLASGNSSPIMPQILRCTHNCLSSVRIIFVHSVSLLTLNSNSEQRAFVLSFDHSEDKIGVDQDITTPSNRN